MNAQTVTPANTAVRYGLIVGLICVIYSFILALLDESGNRLLGAFSYLVLIGGLVMAFKYFKEHNAGYMSFGQGLKIGTLMSLIVGVLASVFMYIYVKFIDDSMMTRIMEVQRAEMEKKGMDEAQIDRAMEMAAKFSTPEMIVVWGIVGFVIMGFIFSLVVAGIMKHSRPEFE